MRAKRAPRSPIMSCSIIPFFKEPRFTKSNEPLPRVGDVPVLEEWRCSCPGDDPRKGRFEDPRKEPRAPNPNILGPIFTPKAILGGFLVLFWMSILGGFLVPFWPSILGGSAPDFSSPLNALPVYVSGRWEPFFEGFKNSDSKCCFSQCPPC